eukprot:Sdes_comp8930_c0_seq1m346
MLKIDPTNIFVQNGLCECIAGIVAYFIGPSFATGEKLSAGRIGRWWSFSIFLLGLTSLLVAQTSLKEPLMPIFIFHYGSYHLLVGLDLFWGFFEGSEGGKKKKGFVEMMKGFLGFLCHFYFVYQFGILLLRTNGIQNVLFPRWKEIFQNK